MSEPRSRCAPLWTNDSVDVGCSLGIGFFSPECRNWLPPAAVSHQDSGHAGSTSKLYQVVRFPELALRAFSGVGLTTTSWKIAANAVNSSTLSLI